MHVAVIVNDRDYFLRHRLPVVEALVGQGAAVTVLAGGNTAPPPMPRNWSFRHLPIDRLSINPVKDAGLFFRALGHLWRLRADALHLITLKPAVYGGMAAMLLRLAGRGPRRVVITIPGLGRLMSPQGQGAGRLSGLLRGCVGGVIGFLSRRRGVVFTFETGHDRQVWIDSGFIRADHSVVVRGAGVDPRRFSPREGARAPGPLRVLYASRLLKSKGLDSFLDAARAMRGRMEFIVAGWGDPADGDGYDPEELAAEKAISFRGNVADMPSLLRAVDLVCLPTRYGEGIPRILIEAAACGLPCIATDGDGCRTIVVDGVTGTIIAGGDPAAITQALIRALESYAASPEKLAAQGEAARRHVLEGGFSDEEVTAEFLSLLLKD